MKQTAVEWLVEEFKEKLTGNNLPNWVLDIIQQAKAMEKEQIFKAKNVSAKKAYEAGQLSMYCGCYEIDGCTNYEEWLYKKFKSE